MALNPRLELRAQQKLALTPDLRLRLGILRMSPAELDDELASEAARNPFLRYERQYSGTGGAIPVEDVLAARAAPFQDDLRRQVLRLGLTRPIEALALFLITELGPDGYLDAELSELAEERDLDPDLLAEALAALQRCEPAGIAARSLAECLELQLKDRGLPAAEARATVALLPDFARMEWKRIGAALGLDAAGVKARALLLRSLSPRPLPEPEPEAGDSVLIADLRVVRPDGEGAIRVEPVEKAAPKARLDLAMVQKAATEGFAPELLARAKALLAALEQRGRTLSRIGDWLAERQGGFFRDGPAGLVPATRVELAGELGLHPSTVGRALAGKAIDVDGRLWPLSVFFSSALPGPQGDVSSRAVQRRIAELIAAEPVGRPLSDETLVSLLRAQGVDIARRTVAKYRQGLRIPPSSTRRRLAASRGGG